jgi:glyceraldehyde-3-phosphate dehydrogenase (NADP+)
MPKDFFQKLHNQNSPAEYKYFNGNTWKESDSDEFISLHSPIDGHIYAKLKQMTFEEINQSIQNLKDGQTEWSDTPLVKRAQIFHLTADWIRHQKDMLTNLLVKEIAKSYQEASDEIVRSADMIEQFAAQALTVRGEDITGDSFPGYDSSKMAFVKRVPHGIVLAISPYNYPVNLAVSKIIPALLMGNTVLFKPSIKGALSALYLTEIMRISGLPDNTISTIIGIGDKIGEYLTGHSAVNMISFTGSSNTGKKIARNSGMIPLSLECGGNNPALILPDADIVSCAKEIALGAFSYSGQRCTAIKYVLSFQDIQKRLIDQILSFSKEYFHWGDPRIQTNNFGPLIDEKAAEEVEIAVLKAKAQGAQILTGGKRNGAFFEPTILKNVKPDMDIISQEIFGPVLSFLTVKSIDEAIKIINDSDYGLQVSLFTADEGSAILLAGKINTGVIQINSKPQRGPDHFPFIGIKDSGLGVQGIKYSLESMTRLKPIILNKPH